MAIRTYQCTNVECMFRDDYIETPSVPKTCWHPEICPVCKIGKMKSVFDNKGFNMGIDVIGGYEYQYGKKNWKQGKTQQQISEYLAPDPDTGRYKDPY